MAAPLPTTTESPAGGAPVQLLEFLQQASEPTRLAVCTLLAESGPQTMTELATRLGLSAPRLANHLAKMKAGGLVSIERRGRHCIYHLADPRAAAALGSLRTIFAIEPAPAGEGPPPLAIARSCYHHLGGRLGVRILDRLVANGALRVTDVDGAAVEVALGAEAAFSALGVRLPSADTNRRHFAVGCLDWTDRRPHLGGDAGRALLDSLVDAGFLLPSSGTRALAVTTAGDWHFAALLGGDWRLAPPGAPEALTRRQATAAGPTAPV